MECLRGSQTRRADRLRPRLRDRRKALLRELTLAEHVQQIAVQGTDALSAEIPNLNGGWGLVVTWPTGEVLAAVDRLRTVPLFFYHNDESFAIAASGVELARCFSLPMSVTWPTEILTVRIRVVAPDACTSTSSRFNPGRSSNFRPVERNPCRRRLAITVSIPCK